MGWSGLRRRLASHPALYPSLPRPVQGVLVAFLNMAGIVLFPGAAIATASLLPVCLALRTTVLLSFSSASVCLTSDTWYQVSVAPVSVNRP